MLPPATLAAAALRLHRKAEDMPLKPRQGRALNAGGLALIVWLFAKAGAACIAGCVVTVLYAPGLALVMGGMAFFCGYVVLTAARALVTEVTARYR